MKVELSKNDLNILLQLLLEKQRFITDYEQVLKVDPIRTDNITNLINLMVEATKK